MKKVLVLVAAVLFGSLAFAEKSKELGVRFGGTFNFGTKFGSELTPETSYSEKILIGYDISIFGHFGIVEMGKGALSLQPEITFSSNNGKKMVEKYGGDTFETEFSYLCLDIALLVGYDIPVGERGFSIRPFLGPKVGIPLGKLFMVTEGPDNYSDTDSIKVSTTIGMDFGLAFSAQIGAKLVYGADVRYGFDFNYTKYKEDGISMDVLRRAGMTIALRIGYRF
ncbi:MAG: PorT family protein [Treponema sp.]|nr:PorT family protein [Treponema sp.]